MTVGNIINIAPNYTLVTNYWPVLHQGRIQTFQKGDSTLELQFQPSCKLKTIKKKGHHLLTIAALHPINSLTSYLSLFITRYIACYTAPQKTTVTALLEYLDLTALLV